MIEDSRMTYAIGQSLPRFDEPHYVYELFSTGKDDLDQLVFYVGRGSRPADRPRDHLSDALDRKNSRVASLVNTLLDQDESPLVRIIARVWSEEEAATIEKERWAHYQSQGMELANVVAPAVVENDTPEVEDIGILGSKISDKILAILFLHPQALFRQRALARQANIVHIAAAQVSLNTLQRRGIVIRSRTAGVSVYGVNLESPYYSSLYEIALITAVQDAAADLKGIHHLIVTGPMTTAKAHDEQVKLDLLAVVSDDDNDKLTLAVKLLGRQIGREVRLEIMELADFLFQIRADAIVREKIQQGISVLKNSQTVLEELTLPSAGKVFHDSSQS